MVFVQKRRLATPNMINWPRRYGGTDLKNENAKQKRYIFVACFESFNDQYNILNCMLRNTNLFLTCFFLCCHIIVKPGGHRMGSKQIKMSHSSNLPNGKSNSAYWRHKGCAFREKGVAQAHGTGICKALEYAAARERHILAPLYAVPLPRYYCRKISIQGAALHKVGPQTCSFFHFFIL